ncbi:2,4-dihydroxyhept-2-ene-1,7-dioic acid aldolase [Xylariales sp. PMI_506]|nr:2,4-dihydroxyhept-2-ene-1,7-dioic acid aldolase [Xylariales sp. PMI_506]
MPSFEIALKTALKSQSTAYGFWLTLPGTALAKTILRAASTSPSGAFNWVLVDGEHGQISDKDYYDLVNAISAEGASPVIRVPWGEEWLIKRALDAGAHGVLTPMCHSAEDAARIVSYCKYPPTGSRGYGPSFAIHSFPGVAAGDHYDANADNELMVMVQIESRSGVDNVEEIAKVPGLDVLLIGPFDLAKQLGVVRGGEEHEAAIQRTLKACKAAGKKAAIFCTDGAQAQLRASQGFDMVSVITDTGVISEGMIRELSIASGKISGESKPRDTY